MRSRLFPDGNLSLTGYCEWNAVRCTLPGRRHRCFPGRLRPRCAEGRCRGKCFRFHFGNFSGKKRLVILNAFEEYWQTGGFPEVAGLDQRLRLKIHQEYFNAMLFRDLVERHDIAHPRAIADLAHWLVDNTGSLYSVNNLTGYLKSLGHKVPKSSVSDYLRWFEDAYVLFTLRIFDASLSRANTNPKKIYCVDHALVRSINSGILANSGHILENLVYTALRRISPDIFYYKTRTGREVDFIVGRQGLPRMLVQVCESMAAEQTSKRETAALCEAMRELQLTESTVVTRNEEGVITVDSGHITMVPAWRFLLSLPEII
jgi:predicted AAA+ superfamily ATPase